MREQNMINSANENNFRISMSWKIIAIYMAVLCTLFFRNGIAHAGAGVALDKDQPGVGKAIEVNTDGVEGDAGDITYMWYIDDALIENNSSSYIPSEEDYEHWIRVQVYVKGELFGSDELYFSRLPVIYINTEDNREIEDKVNYVPGDMYIQGNDEYSSQYSGSMEIRGRGNTSWRHYDQKPYKLKLGKSTDLFGFGKSKHWILVSPFMDESLMRNKLAYDFSGILGLTHMELTWVDVVLNGEYWGNYILCENIRIDDDRIPIYDWNDEVKKAAEYLTKVIGTLNEEDIAELEELLNANYSWITSNKFIYKGVEYDLSEVTSGCDISGGYVFEMSNEWDTVSKFVTSTDIRVLINNPEYLKTNDEMFGYVVDYWKRFEQAICDISGYNSNGEHYQDMADFDSMVSYWLAMEIMGNNDAELKSRYSYKDVGGKLVFGPVWDFDWGMGSVAVGTGATGWKLSKGPLWKDFIDDPYFAVNAAVKYWQVRDYLTGIAEDGGMIDTYYSYLNESGHATGKRWNNDKILKVPRRGFEKDVSILKNYIKNRLEWLDKQFKSAESIVTSLHAIETSTNPYMPSEKGLDISLSNAIDDNISEHVVSDGIIMPETNPVLHISNAADDITAVNIYVNGYKLESVGSNMINSPEGYDISINRSKLYSDSDRYNIISFTGVDAEYNVVYKNYKTMRVMDYTLEDIAAYEFPSKSSGEALGEGYEYHAVSGIFADSSILTASINGTDRRILKYSKELYKDGHNNEIYVPVMSASGSMPWSSEAYYELKCPARGYNNLRISLSLGATKKGPRDYKLSYSTDGVAWNDIEESYVSLSRNKKMEMLYSDYPLPAECMDNNVLYIRVMPASNITVNGDNSLAGSTGGEAAINNIVLRGVRSAITYADYKEIYSEALKLNEDDYTNYNIVKELLKNNIADSVSSQQDIDNAAEKLNSAVKKLHRKENYTLAFNTMGGNDIESLSIREGDAISELPVPLRKGYDFVGWYTDETGNEKYTADKMLAHNITIYAVWKKKEDKSQDSEPDNNPDDDQGNNHDDKDKGGNNPGDNQGNNDQDKDKGGNSLDNKNTDDNNPNVNPGNNNHDDKNISGNNDGKSSAGNDVIQNNIQTGNSNIIQGNASSAGSTPDTQTKKRIVLTVKLNKKKITAKKISIKKGKKYSLTVKVNPSAKIKYKVNNKKVLRITKKGKLIIKKKGKTAISITAGDVTQKYKVIVS